MISVVNALLDSYEAYDIHCRLMQGDYPNPTLLHSHAELHACFT